MRTRMMNILWKENDQNKGFYFCEVCGIQTNMQETGGCLLYNETYAMDASHIGTGLQVKNKVNPPKHHKQHVTILYTHL